MVKRKLGALEKVEADLPNLQHKIRKDPKSYIEDFRAQHYQYESHREIFMASPSSATDTGIISLKELIDFLAHVADCYPSITKDFPQQLMDILTQHHLLLEPELREKIVGSLVLLRKKELLDSATLLQTLFPILITTSSKSLRALIFQKILMDLRTSNVKTKNHKLNRTMQTVLFNLVTSDRTSSKGLWAIKLTRELWKRQIWTDSKAVEVMKEASLAENEKVIVGGVRFFLGGDKEREDMEDESSDEEIDMGKVKHQAGINKKTRKNSRAVAKARQTVKKRERKKNQPHPLNFSALHLLHDPQGYAESLFYKHLQSNKSKLNLEQKLMVLQLVTRLVGLHKLHIMHLYSYFQKYLTPRQPSVTSFLASLAQASHDLIPPDDLEPLVQKIANEFVSEASASEVATAGLNAIREICARQPLAMNETLLQDLVMYRKSKDKGVVMAGRGLLSLFRELNPEMLKRRDRGKDASMGLRSGEKKEKRFGEQEAGGIEGLELLEQWKEEERKKRRAEKGLASDAEDDEEEDEADNWDAWNVEDDEDSDDSGGWIDVQSDAEIDFSDSEDEKDGPPSKKTKQADDQDSAKSEAEERQKAINLATTRILTPADLAKLQELRNEAAVNAIVSGPKSRRAQNDASRHNDDALTAAEIEGLAALSAGKQTREERIAHAKEGKPDRGEHKSVTAKRKERKEEQGKSTTNKEKARRKNFFMTLGKAKSKGKRSLVETRNILKVHHERQKRGGRRGNIG
ncbi:Severe Depolymerization of Actin [Aspergillus nanangensis]|uniref:Protein SDA1 n=1 Tax=Aspergillus nanangensis TaxID=2582783 RepID=A0AAD4CDV9_ASPNN|nr:Severe Depolymerization of Actin [Aspergillus nanangensis]